MAPYIGNNVVGGDPTGVRHSHSTANGVSSGEGTSGGPVETEFLIVGCGPAGASLACFLASYGNGFW